MHPKRKEICGALDKVLAVLKGGGEGDFGLKEPERVALRDWLREQAAAKPLACQELRDCADARRASGESGSSRGKAAAGDAPGGKPASAKGAGGARKGAGQAKRGAKGQPPPGATALLHCDGASRGNPGPAAAGYVVYHEGEELYGGGKALGRLTNNQAEYRALILGLEAVAQLGFLKVEIALDSELIVRQLEGRYKVKNQALKPLYEQARLLLMKFGVWRVRHVPRAENARADALANEALDSL